MRKVVFTFLVVLGSFVYAQNKQLLFAVDDLPQTLMSNPGAAYNFERYYGLPLGSGISVFAGSSGVSVWDVFRESGDINAKIDSAVRKLTDKDVFTVNQQAEIISFGWLGKNEETFYSGGIYQETDFILYFPKDWALLAYDGNAPYIGRQFEFDDIAATAELLNVYHIGMNKKITPQLRMGVRAKVYMSMANVNSTGNSGFFRTGETPGGPNFYRHEVIGADVQANSSGLAEIIDNSGDVSSLTSKALISPNLGLGFDIGGTYNFTDQWSASASLLDIGFISHSKDLKTYRFSGSYQLDGIELEFPAILNGQQTTDYWEEFINEAEGQLPYEDTLSESYITLRPLKFNGGLNYGYGEDWDGQCNCSDNGDKRYTTNVGLHINAIKRPRSVLAAATLYYDRSWFKGLRTRFTYTVDAFSASNLGLLVSTRINNFNLYIAADNLAEYANLAKARSASFQLGMQLVIEPK